MKSLKLICCISFSCLLLASCQKRQVNTSSCCIYDQKVFAESLKLATLDDKEFAQFKRNPFLNLLWENFSREEGEKWLSQIETKYPFLIEKFESFKESDKIGNPRVYSFGERGEFSPTTLRHAALSGELKMRLGELSGLKIIQIGAGYGGLYRILNEVETLESYTLVDLPEHLDLAKKYLEKFGLKNFVCLTPEELPKEAHYDLVLSDLSFSEFNRTYQKLFFERILSKARCGFLLGHLFSKHFGVIPMNREELKERFEKNGKFSKWEFHEPTIEKENYYIFWQRAYTQAT